MMADRCAPYGVASDPASAATIVLYLASGVFGGYALFATTGVLQALFAAGPTPQRVRAQYDASV